MSNIKTPPFLLTYWNPFNKNAPNAGQSFLNYVKDVSLASYTANSVGNYIEESNQEQIEVLKTGFRFLDQRLSRIEQGQINTNILLENIGQLLKVPDSEKQRQLHIERGLKFSNQSLKDGDIAVDAKNEFDAALRLMPQDWFVLQQLAILLLYSEKVLDINLAKDYFLRAAKYANVDESNGATFINNLFNQNLSSPFENKSIDDRGSKVFVREAYLNAALSAYILSDFEEATNIAKKALTNDKEDPKSLFFTAKYLSRNNQKEEAFDCVRKAVTNAPYFCTAVFGDEDLVAVPEILEFCNRFSNEFYNTFELIKTHLNEIKEFLRNHNIFTLIDELNNNYDMVKIFEILEQPLILSASDFKETDSRFSLGEYLLKDLDAKWNEIKNKCDRKKENDKEIELIKLEETEQEKRKLKEYSEHKETAIKYFENGFYGEALNEITFINDNYAKDPELDIIANKISKRKDKIVGAWILTILTLIFGLPLAFQEMHNVLAIILFSILFLVIVIMHINARKKFS